MGLVFIFRHSTENISIEMCYVSSRHEQERHGLTVDDGGDDNKDKYGYYKCRGPCSLVFATNATRKRLSLLPSQ